MSADPQDSWHLDRRVPVAIIVVILIQTSGAVWWASSMSEKVTQIERRLEGFAQRNTITDNRVANQQIEIAVLAEQVRQTNASINGLSAQVKDTNDLLRDILQNMPPRGWIREDGIPK